MARKRKPLIKVLTEEALRAYLTQQRSEEAENWTQVDIAPSPDMPDEADYPIYGRYYFRFLPGTEKRARQRRQVAKRLLDKNNEEFLLALKAGLIDGIEL